MLAHEPREGSIATVLRRLSPATASWRALSDLVGRPTLAPILVANVVLGMAVSFVTPFLSLFGTDAVGMTLTGFGAFMTANACANIAISTFIARKSDQGGDRRRLLLLGGFAGALGYAGYALVRDAWLLSLIGMLVLGVGSITFSQLYAHTRELLLGSDLPSASAPLYMNTCRMAFALAWTVGPALAAWTLQAAGYRGLFLAAAGLHALFVLVVLLGLRSRPTRNPEQPFTAADRPPNPSPLHASSRTAAPGAAASGTGRFWSPTLLRWFLAFCLVFTAQNMAMMNLPLFTLRSLAGSEFQVGIMFSLAPCFEVPLMLYVGWLATRMDSAKLIRVAAALACVYYGLLALVAEPWHVYPLQLLGAAVVSVMGGVAITFFQDKLPGFAGQATNLYGSSGRVGATLGYVAFGVIAGNLGHRATYGVCAGLTALAFGLMPGPRAAISSAAQAED